MVFEPDSPSATKFEEIAIARRQQADEALKLRESARVDPAYMDDEVPAAFELDMLESALILCTGGLLAARTCPDPGQEVVHWTAALVHMHESQR